MIMLSIFLFSIRRWDNVSEKMKTLKNEQSSTLPKFFNFLIYIRMIPVKLVGSGEDGNGNI